MTKLTKAEVTKLVLENDRAVERALIVLFNRQTTSEQHTETTANWNEIGFTGADAHWGSRNAKWLLRGGHLSPFQLAYWRKLNKKGTPRIAKYWRQLSEEAERRAQGKLPLAA